MFSTLSSYIWASEPEDQIVPDSTVETTEEQTENEWVLVDVVKSEAADEIDTVERKQKECRAVPRFAEALEESWYITPPSCFNASQADSSTLETSPLENLLIEHPSMSVYGPSEPWSEEEESRSDSSEQTPGNSQTETGRDVEQRPHTHRRTLRAVDKVDVLKRRVQKNVLQQAKKQIRRKKLERQNKTREQTASQSRRKQKKVDRKQGKHSGVYSNRGC